MENNLNELYPIGKFEEQPFSKKEKYSEHLKKLYIKYIKDCPLNLEMAIANLDDKQLNAPYRDGGWTLKQVVHHVADSHMNALVRFKLALTESNPVAITIFNQDAWSVLPDTALPVTVSISLLKALHIKWVALMENMSDEDLGKTIFHPKHNREMSLWDLIGTYAWHGKHHTAHIINLRKKMGW